MLVSAGQLYGVLLYYTTNYMEYAHSGISYSRPEFMYYWGYYIGINAFWVFIPGCKFDLGRFEV